MKSFKHVLFGLAAIGLAACSTEEPVGPNNQNGSNGDVFASLTLSLPTRSQTVDVDDPTQTNSNAGFEIGKDSENHVTEVLVVLATAKEDGDYDYQTCSLSDARINNYAENKPTYVVQFNSTALNDLVKDASATVNVFAFCNPNAELRNLFLTTDNAAKTKEEFGTKSFINEVLTIASESETTEANVIWNANHFLMSNAALHTAEIPALATLVKDHNTQAKALNLGVVDVKRAAARFDFSETTTAVGTNRYVIKDQVTDNEVAVIELDALALMNEAKNFYALPRVSADGQNTDFTLCGAEISSNWVVSPFADQKKGNEFLGNSNKYYLYNLGENASAYTFTPFSEFCKLGLEDDDNNWDQNPKMNYYIWRYTTENTIPEVDKQQKAITTGVVFRGEIKPIVAKGEEKLNEQAAALALTMTNGRVMYGYKGVLYGDKDALKDAATQVEGSTFDKDYKDAFVKDNLDENGDLKASSHGFAIYRPTGSEGNYHYYVYYYYYNRHNDNGNNNVMGAMEFGVVRNNIYKLAVTNIYEYGHPGDPGDDPDPENPEDPDEEMKAYFKVSVRVLPWVVRINNIEF